MLTAEAMKLLKPNENLLKIFHQNGLVVVETGENWFALNRSQAVEFIQMMARVVNEMGC